jgi:glycosyltransferase involved in cell wall biosynthesis
VRLLFVKDSLAWPRSSGHDVHGSSQMRALARLGHEVFLLTRLPPKPEALAGLDLADCTSFAGDYRRGPGPAAFGLTRWHQRFLSYWGIDPALLPATVAAVAEWEPEAVIALDLTTLPALAAVDGPQRVWYAADELAWHHLSQVRLFQRKTWGHICEAAIGALHERAFAHFVDRAWVVSAADRRAMRWVTNGPEVTVLAHGVDTDHYRPQSEPQVSASCVFWGNLDFGPNVQGLSWFCRRVWPQLRERVPSATFTIYGRRPCPEVLALTHQAGICVVADVPDLRPEVSRHQVVVMPFVSGGGVKNKLLEAASMGKAIVCSPWACGGLSADAPLVVVRSAAQWVEAISNLWDDPGQCRQLGEEARTWICTRHTWEVAARTALTDLGHADTESPVSAGRELERVS